MFTCSCVVAGHDCSLKILLAYIWPTPLGIPRGLWADDYDVCDFALEDEIEKLLAEDADELIAAFAGPEVAEGGSEDSAAAGGLQANELHDLVVGPAEEEAAALGMGEDDGPLAADRPPGDDAEARPHEAEPAPAEFYRWLQNPFCF